MEKWRNGVSWLESNISREKILKNPSESDLNYSFKYCIRCRAAPVSRTTGDTGAAQSMNTGWRTSRPSLKNKRQKHLRHGHGERRTLIAGLVFGMIGAAGMALWVLRGPAAQGLITPRMSEPQQGQPQGANSSILGIIPAHEPVCNPPRMRTAYLYSNHATTGWPRASRAELSAWQCMAWRAVARGHPVSMRVLARWQRMWA